MQHSFNIQIAIEYGVHAAVILNNLYFWVEKNRANNKNFYDGHYWTYNSKSAFSKLFPYMTPRQIEYALKKLIDANIVLTGNYNSDQRDRTLWYTITNLGYSKLGDYNSNTEDAETYENNTVKCIPQNCEMEQTKLFDGPHKIVQPLPYINSHINPVINQSQSHRQTDSDSDNDFDMKNTKKITKGPTPLVKRKIKIYNNRTNYNTMKKILQENIQYDLLIEEHPFEIDIINELFTCMLDICLTKNSTIKINGEEKNTELVKSVYMKINSRDIEHIITQFKEIRHKVKYINSYLKTMLFTCKQENGHFYTNAVRVDGLV